MRRFIFAAFAWLSITLAFVPAASALEYRLSISNYTAPSVWVTIYWSYKSQAHWRIERAFCLEKNKQSNVGINFSTPGLSPQVRVRGEVMKNAGCKHPRVADITRQRDLPSNSITYYTFKLRQSGGGYTWDNSFP